MPSESASSWKPCVACRRSCKTRIRSIAALSERKAVGGGGTVSCLSMWAHTSEVAYTIAYSSVSISGSVPGVNRSALRSPGSCVRCSPYHITILQAVLFLKGCAMAISLVSGKRPDAINANQLFNAALVRSSLLAVEAQGAAGLNHRTSLPAGLAHPPSPSSLSWHALRCSLSLPGSLEVVAAGGPSVTCRTDCRYCANLINATMHVHAAKSDLGKDARKAHSFPWLASSCK